MPNTQSRREKQTTAFQEAGFAPEHQDGSLFSFDFEKSLGYHIGEQLYNCIPQVRKLVPELKARNAVGYSNRIERNGVDGYIWLEKDEDDIILMGFQNQNVSYLVYILAPYRQDEIHIRQIWRDYFDLCKSGHYMLGKSQWDNIENPCYEDVIIHGHTAVNEYSDDLHDEQGRSLMSKGSFVKRPSLKTHLEDLSNSGMRYKDGRDNGYIASVTVNNLTNKPYCNSPTSAMKNFLEYVFMDFKSVLNLPCLAGDN